MDSRKMRDAFCISGVSTEDRVAALQELVLVLAIEVEALRRAHLTNVHYQKAYEETGLLSHNDEGMSSGQGKVLDLFSGGEVGMLRRFGFSPDQIELYLKQASFNEGLS